jgi:hypothetical protein
MDAALATINTIHNETQATKHTDSPCSRWTDCGATQYNF